MRRRAAVFAAFAGALLIEGCATPVRPPVADAAEGARNWSGRLSLRIDSEPVQTFAAMFDLRGTPVAGDLILTSPIGSTLAALHWSPTEAFLKSGNETRRYGSVDALIAGATGAAIPVEALFGWLDGRDQSVPGWRADLGQIQQGRLRATRESPQPEADLRIVFERQ